MFAKAKFHQASPNILDDKRLAAGLHSSAWTESEQQVMFDILSAKFSQHQDLCTVILSTIWMELIEGGFDKHGWAGNFPERLEVNHALL